MKNRNQLQVQIDTCIDIIGNLCKDARPPKMSVPVRSDDEDQYLVETLKTFRAMLEYFETVDIKINRNIEQCDIESRNQNHPPAIRELFRSVADTLQWSKGLLEYRVAVARQEGIDADELRAQLRRAQKTISEVRAVIR